MKRLTVRMDDYTYKKLYIMSCQNLTTMNGLINELIQIGYIFKESEMADIETLGGKE